MALTWFQLSCSTALDLDGRWSQNSNRRLVHAKKGYSIWISIMCIIMYMYTCFTHYGKLNYIALPHSLDFETQIWGLSTCGRLGVQKCPWCQGATCKVASSTQRRDDIANTREVDIMNDEPVWAILHEGCNATCHSRMWRENAEEKFLNQGSVLWPHAS